MVSVMKSAEIRRRFLDFFARHGHEVVASSPLVPANDPTLLFTNAGMVQFKEVFQGLEKRSYTRAASSQRCVRAGGKHNDLENVGYTARHHTFFEMLGNFSFGDYFKREAIQFAWDFLTEELGLPAERLWVTVYQDDDEAADIWRKEIGVEAQRCTRLGAESNFWSMGETGPCGPCTEIFYDHGPEVAGGPPGSADEDGDRYVEIWNLVFMQYNRDEKQELHPLPRPSVDTGMGLERLAAVMQGVHSNYDIDLFRNLINAAAELTGTADRESNSLRVIADHIRACAFLVADGVLPSNEGRGYVLRRIIRRAARHGYELGTEEPFFYRLLPGLVAEMGTAYPELAAAETQIAKVLKGEEERFAETLSQGMKILETSLAELGGDVLPGETVFRLYDTYGFPVDLTADIAQGEGVTLDMAGYEAAMAAQRERARAASSFKMTDAVGAADVADATFTGYETLSATAQVQHIYVDGESVDHIESGQSGVVYLDKTAFYAESGGQVGDRGWLRGADGVLVVEDTQTAHAHVGHMEQGRLRVGDTLRAEVDGTRRQATVYNHSATHLMHAALKKVLGEHVQQKGSLVAPDRLRFDFSHFEPMTPEQLTEIETLVNSEIRANHPAETRVMALDDAMAAGAVALFGEKYGETVRVVAMGDFSTELCGGTHVARTGDIGLFKILSEGGVAAGVRRIEAVTGAAALAHVKLIEQRLQRVAQEVKGSPEDAEQKVAQLHNRLRSLEKEVEALRGQLAAGGGKSLVDEVREINGIKVLAARLDGADAKALRDAVDQLKDKLQRAAVVLGAVRDDKVLLVAGVTKDLSGQLPAGELVNHVAVAVGGKGGGRPDMAQAGGNNPAALDAALDDVYRYTEDRLS